MEILIHCISSAIMEIMILCISSSWRFWLYIVHGDDHLCHLCIMPIHGHCTLMYPGLLYVFAVMCRVVSLYYANWVVGIPFGTLHHSTFWMDLQCISAIIWPLWPHTLGGICYNWYYHTWWITPLWSSLPPCRLFRPHEPFLYLWCFQDHP